MRGRAGVVALVLALFAAGLAAGAIQAGPTLTTIDTTTTASPPPTTTDVTTAQTTTLANTTTAVTTTVATTTAATTTTPVPTPTPKPKPRGKLLAAAPLAPPRCLLLAGFVLIKPGRQPVTLGRPNASATGVAYPADGSILTASSVNLSGSGCGKTARANAVVSSLSLFGGAVAVRRIELGVRGGIAGKTASVTGLVVGKNAVAATPGRTIAIGPWGYVVPLAERDEEQAGALSVHLTKAHAGLPAGTVLLVGFAQLAPPKVVPAPARPAAKPKATKAPQAEQKPKAKAAEKPTPKKSKRHKPKRKHKLGDEPLKVTPPLGLSDYVFPIAGRASYGDSYGGFRGDVPGNWHHGDDIFAPLGTPVVAVADGRLNRVGWQRLGGWRLWVRDHNRNQFYYAHLSGYSPLALRSEFVKKGDVIGFVGNSGDAFTTPPHLHFEIHPHQLLRLHYNGAVNPTPYIDGWRHLVKPKPPNPVHPPFPAGAVRSEARYIWRELLAARGLIVKPPKPSERPRIFVPGGDHEPSARRLAAAGQERVSGRQTSSMFVPDLLVGVVAPALLFAGVLALRLRRERP